MYWRALSVWFVLLAAAIANGAFREAVLSPMLGPSAAHVVSTLGLSAVVLAITWLSSAWVDWHTMNEALLIGVTWTTLVLAFEFLAGHFLFQRSWEYLLADYNLLRGRIWPLVLLTTLLAPLMVWRLMMRTS
jgi:hypothetical protein